MKKLMLIAALFCATAVVSQAEPPAAPAAPEAAKKVKKELTAEQKELRKEMVAKYDANKNGRLAKDEIAAMSAEDKAKWEKAGFGPKKKTEEAPKKD